MTILAPQTPLPVTHTKHIALGSCGWKNAMRSCQRLLNIARLPSRFTFVWQTQNRIPWSKLKTLRRHFETFWHSHTRGNTSDYISLWYMQSKKFYFHTRNKSWRQLSKRTDYYLISVIHVADSLLWTRKIPLKVGHGSSLKLLCVYRFSCQS